MKITHIITRLIVGGAQENTLLNVEGLARQFSDELDLITWPPLGAEGSLLEDAEKRGIRLRVIPELRRNINPLRDTKAYLKILRELRDLKPDVVHTHSAKAGLLGRCAAAKRGTPVIIHTIHGSFYAYRNQWMNRLYIAAERYASRWTTAFISVADAMTEQAIQSNVGQKEQFTTIYSGMEVDPFLESGQYRQSVRGVFGYDDRHVVVGKIARLFDLKGHEFLIDAARSLVKRFPNIRFLLVGDGLLRKALSERISRLGLESHFCFAGLRPPEEIPGLISAMDVLVHCSLREGLARVLPQALISGKPVVSFNIDGAREVVIPDKTGFLLPAGSTQLLSESIGKLVESPQLRRSYGLEGRRQFTNQFRHQYMTQQIRALYLQCLETHGTSG